MPKDSCVLAHQAAHYGTIKGSSIVGARELLSGPWGCKEARGPTGELPLAPYARAKVAAGPLHSAPSLSRLAWARWGGRGQCKDTQRRTVLNSKFVDDYGGKITLLHANRPHRFSGWWGRPIAILGWERAMGVVGDATHGTPQLTSPSLYPVLGVQEGIRLPLPRQPPLTRKGNEGSVTIPTAK